MKVFVIDSKKGRNAKVSEAVKAKGYDVVSCISSNDLMTSIEESLPDRFLADTKSWLANGHIFSSFDISAELAEVPLVMYNTPENFTSLKEREGCESDMFFSEDVDIEDVINNI